MKKLLAILMLLALFVSCSDDDNTDPNSGNGNGKDMIDEKIIGKWKVEYSKNIGTFVPNSIYPNDAYYKIFEYSGDYAGTKETMPKVGMYTNTEIGIEFDKEGNMKINYVAYKDPHFGIVEERYGEVNYKTSNDTIHIDTGFGKPLPSLKYYLDENKKLIIERKYNIWEQDPKYNQEYLPSREGTVYSRYSRVKE